MPERPTYTQVAEFAAKLTDKSKEQYGFCQRGKPGWGENMAFVGPMVNAFGGRWFDEKWQPQLTTQPWKDAVNYYVENMNKYGPPGATANGHNENRALFATGHCALWVDATSAAGYIYNPKESQVADKTAFALAPMQVTDKGAGWFWAWSLGIPSSSKKADTAKSFVKWSTSKDYVKLVGQSEGWVSAPPGTRKSTYDNPEYQKAAPFAKVVYDAISNADITHPTKDPVPYVGIQYVAIPEFQGIGTTVGQQIAAALAGSAKVDAALENAQRGAERVMKQAGYIK
jgi:sorbitol/mannitol transport system substrate-binding protein